MCVAADATPSPALRRLGRLLIGAMVLVCLVGTVTPAGPTWDFANFYDTGRRVAAGQLADIYDATTLIAGEEPLTKLDFYGTPLSALLYAPLALLSPPAALVAFKVENTLALWAALFLLFRFTRQVADPNALRSGRTLVLFVAAALFFQPFWTIYRVGGQSMPTVFLLLVVGLIAHVRGSVRWSSLCFVAVVAIKPVFIFGLVFATLASGRRFAFWVAAHGAWLGVVSLAVFGWPIHEVFVTKMLANSGRIAKWAYNSSPWIVHHFLFEAIAQRGGDLGNAPAIAGIVLRIAGIASLGLVAWRSWRMGWAAPARAHFVWIAALLFTTILAQTVWEHYLMILFPLVAHWIASEGSGGPALRRLITTLVLACLLQNIIVTQWLDANFDFDSLLTLAGILVAKSAPVWLAWWIACRHHARWSDSYARGAWTREFGD